MSGPDHHRELESYNDAMRDLDRDNDDFNKGVTHTVELLAKVLGVTNWVAGDGSEDYDEDLGQTLMNIITVKGLYDEETGEFAALTAGKLGT